MLGIPSRCGARLPHSTQHEVAEIDAEVCGVLREIGAVAGTGSRHHPRVSPGTGEPRCCKSFLALALGLAVSVAAGTACLLASRCHVPAALLLYATEDALHIARRRLEGICAAADLALRRSRRAGDQRGHRAARSRGRSRRPRCHRRQTATGSARPRSVRAPASDRRECLRRGTHQPKPATAGDFPRYRYLPVSVVVGTADRALPLAACAET